MYSGNTLLIAEVIRDLFGGMKDMNKSYAERILFDKAFDRFVLEYAIAMNIHQVDANKIIYDILNDNYIASHQSEVNVNKNDDAGDLHPSRYYVLLYKDYERREERHKAHHEASVRSRGIFASQHHA